MNKSIALLSIMAIVGLASNLFAQPNDVVGWSKAKWGMSEDQVITAFEGKAVRVEDISKLEITELEHDLEKFERNVEKMKPNLSQEEYHRFQEQIQEQRKQNDEMLKNITVFTTVKIQNYLINGNGNSYSVEFSFNNETKSLQSISLLSKQNDMIPQKCTRIENEFNAKYGDAVYRKVTGSLPIYKHTWVLWEFPSTQIHLNYSITESGNELEITYTDTRNLEGKSIGKHLKEIRAKYGFKDISFGTKYQEVVIALRRIATKPNDLILGREGSFSMDITKLWHYNIGGKEYLIEFFFDHKDRFYCFEVIWPWPETADYLDSIIKKDVEFLTDVFRNKYGNPASCKPFPSILEISSGTISTFCKWETKEVTAFTGVREEEHKFYAVGRVLDDMFFNEYWDHKNKKQSEKAVEGAKDF